MTQREHTIKWLMYSLVFLPVLICDVMVLNRFPILGVAPMLMPLAVAAVAALEGSVAGAGFGLAVGLVCDALYGSAGSMTLLLPLCGAGSGIVTRYGLRQNIIGCLVCSLLTLLVIDLWRVGFRMFWGFDLQALLQVAALEILYSLPFALLVFPLNNWVHRRLGGSKYF